MKTIIAAAHSHTWFLTQTFLQSLKGNTDTKSVDAIVLVDNSWHWSPSIAGIKNTHLGHGIDIVNNRYPARFHASALDMVVEDYDADYLVTMETDCLLLSKDWLPSLLSHLGPNDYAAGAWHHEHFINPSVAVYRMSVLKEMLKWCRSNKSNRCYWGDKFTNESEVFYDEMTACLGPFSDRRGWTRGTVLKETPTGQMKGPGHYEPAQMLYHWAIEAGYGRSIIPTGTVTDHQRHIPISTYYGNDPKWAVHLWAGTRALDILKHPVTDPAIVDNTTYWLKREGDLWIKIVAEDIRKATLEMIKRLGWYTRDTDQREKDAVNLITGIYKEAGVPL